jgi:hypothetical protein
VIFDNDTLTSVGGKESHQIKLQVREVFTVQ